MKKKKKVNGAGGKNNRLRALANASPSILNS